MRPKKLVMQAFGSYGKKTEIDFTKSKQHLFLITGDTGAGKTTIFDAIVFALFGEASSGYNKKSGEELQSQFVDYGNEPFVEFTFTEKVGSMEEEYRVRRIPRHIRPYKKGKEGYTDEKEKVSLFFPDNTEYSQNLKETNSRIEEIIKLTKNQFMQVSMIAQGEFMEVLRGSDKQAIFRKLFNTEIYQNIIKELKLKSDDKKTLLKEFTSQCKLLISGIRVPEAMREEYNFFDTKKETDITDIEKARLSLSNLCKELDKIIETKEIEDKELFAKRDKKTRELAEGEQLLELFAELEKAEFEVKELEAKKEEIAKLTKLAKDIEAAYEIKNYYTGFVEADKSFLEAATELKLKKSKLPELTLNYEDLCKKEEVAKMEYSTAVEESNRISEKVRKNLESFKNIEARKKDKTGKEAEREKAAKEREEAKLKLENFESLEQSWNEAVKELSAFEKMYSLAENKVRSCEKADNELKALTEADRELVSEKNKLKKYQNAYETEFNRFKSAEDELISKRRLFYDLRAGIIARDLLKEGEPCPVCGSVSHPSPCKLTGEEGEITKEEVDELEERVSGLKDKVNAGLSKLEGCKIKITEREGYLTADKKKLIKLINEELFELECETSGEDNTDLEKLEVEIKLFSDKHQKELSELDAKIKEIKSIEEKLSTAGEKKNLLRQAEEAAREKEGETAKELSGIDSVIKELEAGLEYNTKEEALEAEAVKEKEKIKTETVYRAIENKVKEAKSLKERTETLIVKLEADLPLLEKARETKRLEYMNAMERKNISENEWQNIVKEHKKIEKDEFQSIINTYQGNKTASENMVVKMKEATKDKVKPDISELQKEFELVEEAYKDLHTELEEMRAEYKTDEDILKKLDSALAERGAAAEEYGVINNLYAKLSGNVSGARMDIETFVQRKYLEKILISANKRFANMSAGQFELRTYGLEKAGEGKNRGLDLMVYSALNGKCRDVRTLSGGESFMAALSLALGMADQIQERSGAVNLEMMFVDEGFGTLDDNSRNQAVKILKNMAGGSKLIGIISHVSELKQEIEEQLVVTKDENGSRARWQLS